MKKLSRKDILDADDLKITEVEVPEWGGTVYIKELDVGMSLSINAQSEDEEDNGQASVLEEMFINSVCDENGEPLFTEEDRDKLKRKSPRAFLRITKEIQSLNTLSEDEEKNSTASWNN